MVTKIEKGLWEATKENGTKNWFTTKKEALAWVAPETKKEISDEERFEHTRNAYLY